ncbi:Uncharacterised protein [Mycobacteroides abscessus subsp. bolletii]|nr:Uncharacterised protein [Mycobacteroides abscessus subsp. bolletii]
MVGQPGQIRRSQGNFPLRHQRVRAITKQSEAVGVTVSRTQRERILLPHLFLRPRILRQIHMRDDAVLVDISLSRSVNRAHRIQIGDGLQHRPFVILVTVQRLNRRTGHAMAHKTFADVPQKHRVRPKFQEHPIPVHDERIDGFGEQDAVAHVLAPVVRVSEDLTIDLLTSDRRIHRNLCLAWGQPRQRGSQFIEDGIHQLAVVRHLDVQHPGENPVAGKLVVQGLQCRGVTGECRRRRAVDGGDAYRGAESCGAALGLLGVQAHREHTARPRRLGLQTRPVE